MRISEKSQQIEIWDFLMNDPNIMFGYTSPMERLENLKVFNQLVLMNSQNIFLIDLFLLKKYNSFSQNTESSLEQ